MRKRTFVSLAVIALLALGAIALGMGRMNASAHIQTPTVQTQLNNQQAGPEQETQDNGAVVSGAENGPPDQGETTGSAEDQSQDQNLPGGGHQDQGQTDHQFEGAE